MRSSRCFRSHRLCAARVALAMTWLGLAGPLLAADARPNVVLCMADDQGWGDVGYNGHPVLKTPVMDAMAASALRLDRFYSAAPVCSPTRGSVMTGRHPNRFGCFSWGYTLRPQEVTVAEALQSAGYTTGHFGKWHLGSVRAESPVSPGHSGFDEWLSSPNFFENSPLMSHKGKVVQTEGEGSAVIVDAALRFIRAAAGSQKPFLAVIWFGSPHLPYEALPADRALYPDQPEKVQNYYGEITAMDRALGHLRDELRSLGLAQNTLLWYTSDNGATGAGSTGGLRGRKGQLWEGGIRVPTIIEWPAKIPTPRHSSMPCGTVDIYPTVLELAQARVAHQPPLDGESLLPLIEGRREVRQHPLGFWDYPGKGIATRSADLLKELQAEQQANKPAPPQADPGLITQRYSPSELPGHAAWIDGPWKLHRLTVKGRTTYELYNLADDAQETTDLAAGQAKRVDAMKAALQAWQESVIRSLNGEDYTPAK